MRFADGLEVRLAAAAAALSLFAFAFAAALGWPGSPDPCLSEPCWCEPIGSGGIREFWNTLSNVPVFGVSIGLAAHAAARRKRGERRAAWVLAAFAYAAWMEATGALFYHASLLTWTSVLDGASVLGIWGVIFSTSLLRGLDLSGRRLLALVVITSAFALFYRAAMFTVIEWPGLTYLGCTLLLEAYLLRTGPRPLHLFGLRLALLALLASTLAWSLALPTSGYCMVFPGHALWHVTASLAVASFGLHAAHDAQRREELGSAR